MRLADHEQNAANTRGLNQTILILSKLSDSDFIQIRFNVFFISMSEDSNTLNFALWEEFENNNLI